jgi:hypothetical protein
MSIFSDEFYPKKNPVDLSGIAMLKPIKMAMYEFKGEESISEWMQEMEEMCIQMMCAVDKQGLLVYVDTDQMVNEFGKAVDKIRASMNNDKGSGAMLYPGAPRAES